MYLSYLTSLYNKGRKKKSEIINELLNFSYVWAFILGKRCITLSLDSDKSFMEILSGYL